MSPLQEEITSRLDALFQRLAAGDDSPPGPRLRLEGMLEAAVLIGEASSAQLQALIAERHDRFLGATMGEGLVQGWEKQHPFPQIPAYAARAPVTPSTRD